MKEQKTMEESYKDLFNYFYNDFDTFLNYSFSMDYWESGAYTNQRVKCSIEKNSLKKINGIKEKGIYIFGCDDKSNRLLYIGKTKQTLLKRLSGRYLFREKSQCKLAKEYEMALLKGGEKKTIEAITNKYKISLPRALGVKKFGEIGMKNIWFLIIPIDDEKIISALESTMISIGNKWNKTRGFKPLINIDK